MKVLVQWALSGPEAWEEVQSEDWTALPMRDDPTGLRPGTDLIKGWINAIQVQGVRFRADHYAVEHLDRDAIRVTTWSDDPRHAGAGQRFAEEWTFYRLDFNSSLGYALTTKQWKIAYCEGDRLALMQGTRQERIIRPWSEFSAPASALVRHGKDLEDEHYDKHVAVQSSRSWREWTEGVNAADLVDGRVKQQRPQGRYSPALGTRTYYGTNGARANGLHVGTDELAFELAAGGGETIAESTSIGTDELSFSFITPASEPNSGDWPSGTYRFQLDCDGSTDSTMNFGMLTVGGSSGHFAKLVSGHGSEVSFQQVEGAFSGTGLKLATSGVQDPAAGAASDLWECLIAQQATGAHGSDTLSMTCDSDLFTDGPWSGSGVVCDQMQSHGIVAFTR